MGKKRKKAKIAIAKSAQVKAEKKPEKKNAFPDVKQEFYFNLADGRQLKNLIELSAVLEDIDENTFRHHVNEEKNDFANWIRDVINENMLAESLSAKNSKTEHQIEVLKFIVKKLI